jgi:hypothetical protein
MQVTCQICRKKIERDTAYKRVIGNVNKYYCSKQEWQTEEDKKKRAAEDKEKAYRLVCDVMGEKEIINTALWKEWQVWNKVADNEKIAKYLEENREYLTSVMMRLGSSEYARIRYLSAIIRDKIKALVPKAKVEEVPRVVDTSFELFEPTIEKNPQVEEQVLYDVEDDLL